MALINAEELTKQIKSRNFSPVYVLCGTEQMYIKEFTKKLVNAVAGKQPSDFNYHTFSEDVDLDTLAAAVQVVPFMSEYNCVLVSDIYLDRLNSEDSSKFKAICKSVAEGTVLIISMPTYVPKNNTALWKSIQKRAEKDGTVVKFNVPDDKTIEKYIAKWANEQGKFISRVDASRLIKLCGKDMNLLKNEVAKICAYSQGEEVSGDAIDKLVSTNLEYRVFALSEAVLSGMGDKAFRILDVLFMQKEEPVMILYALSTSFIDAYRVCVAIESGVNKKTIAEDFDYGKRYFVLDNVGNAALRLGTEALRKSLDALAQADLKMKSVTVNQRLHLEQLIAQLLLIAKEGRK